MSHGGMGGGGGHGHGGGYGGHGHHGHHGAMAGHHADQSPGWNMAMQFEKSDGSGRRLTFTDPRILVGTTLAVFVVLITLPYTMDYMQNQHYSKQGAGETAANQPAAPDSTGPSPAALAMVGTTLMGHQVNLPSNGFGLTKQQAPAAPATQAANSSAIPSAYGTPELVEQSARSTVKQMSAASGLAPGSAGFGGQSPAVANFGTSVLNAQPAPEAPSYGGAVRSNDGYYVFMPNQGQFGQAGAAPVSPAGQTATGPQAPMGATQIATLTPQAVAGASRQAMERNPFNPQTSAISCPLGMRTHGAAPTMPMLPSSNGANGSPRMRVWVPR